MTRKTPPINAFLNNFRKRKPQSKTQERSDYDFIYFLLMMFVLKMKTSTKKKWLCAFAIIFMSLAILGSILGVCFFYFSSGVSGMSSISIIIIGEVGPEVIWT